jgi:diguanylate cyclase (GGDEF)-like protein/PAS domain S-box-containing protein
VNTELLLTALAECRDGIVITDASTTKNRIIYANKAFQQMTGFSECELIDKGTRFLLGDKTRPTAAKAFRQALGDGVRVQVTLSAVCKDGVQKWIEISGGPIEYEGEKKRYFVGTCRDVDDRVGAIDALMASEITFEETDVDKPVSSYDVVTSLYNRSYFEEVAEREWMAMQKEQRPLSLFLINIANIEKFRGQEGIVQNNKVMAGIAGALRQVFRRGIDLVAKYNEERFIVISTGMAWEEAELMGNRLKMVADKAIKQLAPEGAGLFASTAVATQIPEVGFHVDRLIEAAEKALSKASESKDGELLVAESEYEY